MASATFSWQASCSTLRTLRRPPESSNAHPRTQSTHARSHSQCRRPFSCNLIEMHTFQTVESTLHPTFDSDRCSLTGYNVSGWRGLDYSAQSMARHCISARRAPSTWCNMVRTLSRMAMCSAKAWSHGRSGACASKCEHINSRRWGLALCRQRLRG